MKSALKTPHSTFRSLHSSKYAQGYGKVQGLASKVSTEPWQQELAKARKKFKRLSNGRCLSQELIEERAHEH
jgi:hypothetical protein